MIEAYLEKRFRKKLDPERIRGYCASLPMDGTGAKIADNKTLTVSCVQRRINPVKRVARYIDMLHGFIQEAAEQNAELVVFPEYNFFDLLGLIPGFGLIDRYLNKAASKKDGNDPAGEGGDSMIAAIFGAVAGPVKNCLHTAVSALAEGFGVHIYTGSYLTKEREQLYSEGALFGPDGRLIGTQRKLHLTDAEERMGYRRGHELLAYTVNGIKIAIPICMDATYFETFRLARRLGADVVVIPIANNEEYTCWRALRGIWPRVQESYVYGAKASLNGWIAGMHFTGRAGVFGPMEMTEKRDGVFAVAPHYEGDCVITHTLDIEELRGVRDEAQYFGDGNTQFEAHYTEIYEGGPRDEE